MAVKIGHASIDENGKIQRGAAGDQTGKEVCTRNWYKKPWTSVIRPKNKEDAEAIAKAMEQACANNNIGYDQSQRTTLYSLAKKVKWDLSKITTKCECDCSSLVAVCVNAAGIKVSKDIYTGNELSALKATGKFTVYTASSYINGETKLKRGDILLGKGHTAVVLSNGESVKGSSAGTTTAIGSKIATDPAQKKDSDLSGTYVTTANLYIRNGAGTNKKAMTVLPKGTKAVCYGYYTLNGTTKWLYVEATVQGVKYTGFCSGKYLAKP